MDHSGTMTASCFSTRRRRWRHLRSRRYLPERRSAGRHARTSGWRASAGAPASNGRLPGNPALPQQEGQQLLAFAAKVVRRRLAGSHEIAHRLMSRVRCLDPCQFAGPMQSRQRDRIAPVLLDALARPFRNQGRRDHHAIMAESPRTFSTLPPTRIGAPLSKSESESPVNSS